jgi:hypothetical protein
VKTANIEGKNTILALFVDGFGIRGIKISLKRNPREQRGKPVQKSCFNRLFMVKQNG